MNLAQLLELNSWLARVKVSPRDEVAAARFGAMVAGSVNALRALPALPESQADGDRTTDYAGRPLAYTAEQMEAHGAACAAAAAPHKIAFDEWLSKTYWVQEQQDSFSFNTLGMHRADVMRREIEHLRRVSNLDQPEPQPSDEQDDAIFLETFMRQLVHYDFCGDNPTDLRNALRARWLVGQGWRASTVKAAVNRFLGWRLPATFNPDCGISFDGRKPDEWNKHKGWPIGTNLLTALEAQEMFEHCLTKEPK